MNKLFICLAATMLLMGCTSVNHIENASDQAQEISKLNEQRKLNSIIQSRAYEAWPFKELWAAYRVWKQDRNEAYAVTADNEIVEQGEDQPLTIVTQGPVTTEASVNEMANIDIRDIEIVPEPYSANKQPQTNKVIYLTFDDGPSPNTPKVLDILKQENVKATFFVTGHHKKYVHFIKREFEEGHTIGAHTFSHKYSIYVSQEAYFDDLEKLQTIIMKYTGSRTKLIRFPGGSSNTIYLQYNEDPYFMYNLCKEVRRRGYQYFDWNLSSKDSSSRTFVPTSTIIAKACRAEKDNICLLMHDSFGKETTVEALPSIIQYYKENGYRFATLDVKSSGYHHIISSGL